MFPLVAIEYGHTRWASRTSCAAVSESTAKGSDTYSGTARTKALSPAGSRLTAKSIVISPAST